MSEPSTAEFMRFSAPDADAHARRIAGLREKHAQAVAAGGDPLTLVDHAADLAGLLTTARQEAEALRLLQPHADAAEALPHEEAAGWFWNAYATALQYTGDRTQADRYFAKALGLPGMSGWPRLRAMVLQHWGRNLAEQGRFDEAEARISEALALRVELDDARQELSRRALALLADWRGGHAG